MLGTIWPNAGLGPRFYDVNGIVRRTGKQQGQYCVMNRMKPIELIARHAREVLLGLETHQFIPSDRLVDLGANSVDRAEIAMLVQE
jgi:hypothetical protein